MPIFASLALLASVSLAPDAVPAGAISPGSPAPKLAVKTWYKGKPVTDFAAKGTYVVEFWATWCGPCIESIPHLTEIAKKNKDVTFVGVSIWEEDKGGNIKKFVDKMGKKMDYNVGYSGNKDGMSKTWMEAAGQNGIPTAFVVKDRKIMWVGHPMELAGPLAQVKAGKFDVKAFKTKFDKNAAQARAEMAAYQAMDDIEKQFAAGKRDEAKSALAALEAKTPSVKMQADAMRFVWLSKEDPAAFEVQAKAMAESKDPQKIQQLCTFAYSQSMKPEGAEISRKTLDLALTATDRKDYMVLWYGAEVYKQLKDDVSALAVTNDLLALFPNSPLKDQKDFKAKLEKDKAELEAKVAKASGAQ